MCTFQPGGPKDRQILVLSGGGRRWISYQSMARAVMPWVGFYLRRTRLLAGYYRLLGAHIEVRLGCCSLMHWRKLSCKPGVHAASASNANFWPSYCSPIQCSLSLSL